MQSRDVTYNRLRRQVFVRLWSASARDFSSEALEVMDTPSSPVRTALMLSICLLFAFALAAAWYCDIDVQSESRGRLQAVGRSKVIQPLEAAKVAAIKVRNGERVHKGDVLLEFDPTEVGADRDEYARQTDELSAEIVRRRQAILAARSREERSLPSVPFPPSIESSLKQRELQVLAADLRQLWASIRALDAKTDESVAQRDGLSKTMEEQQTLVHTLAERLKMRQDLQQAHLETLANVIDARETLEREMTSFADHRGQWAQLVAEISAGTREREQTIAKFIQENSQGIADAEGKFDDARQQLVKAGAKAARSVVTSPVDGVVQELAVTTIGQVVASGQQLMTIVPDQGPMEIEALISNLDIGFVKAGERAVVKVDAFPFTIYGTLSGEVISVSRDAVDGEDPQEALPTADAAASPIESGRAASAGVPKTRNLVFPATIRLDESNMAVDGSMIPLSAGMTVNVEIITGRRRVIDFLLAPLRDVASTALRER